MSDLPVDGFLLHVINSAYVNLGIQNGKLYLIVVYILNVFNSRLELFQEQIKEDKTLLNKFVDDLKQTGTEGNKLSYLQEVLSKTF